MSKASIHTPEPWDVWHPGRLFVVPRRNFSAVCELDPEKGRGRAVANADRIVACVNALAGIADPAAVGELLEACEDMLAGWRYIRETHGDLPGVGWDRCEDAARAAIAKAKGGGE